MEAILAVIAREISWSEISSSKHRGQGFFPFAILSALKGNFGNRARGQSHDRFAVFNPYVKRLNNHAFGIIKIIVRMNLAAENTSFGSLYVKAVYLYVKASVKRAVGESNLRTGKCRERIRSLLRFRHGSK